ncbi:helix-turn-helix domain-containing protein [Flavobacterium sp. F-65]|uniref:Helix-turn-helix domain-containing protein n=1 Tax=Flavobacterium pisciphilum TaxID=2893755 RepID=A0ABS8MVL8_9FLAO|nr:helix-turn-helix transcriptional regulator [Flavobacterium sp. F-65]MCC9072814.1 helix-turn-helix domain-containing protein [Flavobacterium sp. F-65]
MNVIIGNKLKELRKSKNISQEEAADYLHLSQSAYARIESGQSNSWASHINKICEIFKISPEDLVKDEIGEDKEDNSDLNETFIINQLSDKIIEQYEARIKELKKVIKDLKRKRNI